MLSKSQYFCLGAMNLSHGIAPDTPLGIPIEPAKSKEQPFIPEHAVSTVKAARDIPQKKKAPIGIKDIIADTVPAEIAKKIAKPLGTEPKNLENLDDWSVLQTAVTNCTFCTELSQTRSQTIFGQGSQQAQLLIISEAPSSDEDIQGSPFVGRAGELLNNMLFAINIKREDTFITNIIKCLPPNNRDPHKEEAAACKTFLNAQINALKPTLILALGRIAAHHLLQVKTPVGQLRGTVHQHVESNIPLIVSYHPAYLLRNAHQKQKSWDDLKRVHQHLNTTV